MIFTKLISRPFSLRIATMLALAFCFCSCATRDPAYDPKCVSVEGKVTLDDHPLSAGIVSFVPDKSNPLHVPAMGTIGQDGRYKISTGGKTGAPVGPYKVCVYLDPRQNDAIKRAESRDEKPPDDTVRIPLKYRNADQTPLSIEVVTAPAAGVYDLKLTSK